MSFDPERLFERDRVPAGRGSMLSVCDDIAADRRAVLKIPALLGEIESGNATFTEILAAAIDRNLAVVLRPSRSGEVAVYILKLDQMWRVSALETLRETGFVDGRWSDAAQQQELLLLGVPAKARARALAYDREHQAAWTCLTVYTLLSAARRRDVIALGKRCFGTDIAGMELLAADSGRVLKRTAYSLVPKGFTFARAGLAWSVARPLFDGPRARVVVPADVDVNAALVSNVQFLTRSGWK
ncbi:MAG: hypothetical protein ABI867_35850 [Kofleriaceae bacterium]